MLKVVAGRKSAGPGREILPASRTDRITRLEIISNKRRKVLKGRIFYRDK